MDIAQLTNAPRLVSVGPVTLKVRPLKFREWGEVQQWLKDNADDPLTEALRGIDKARRKGIEVAPAHEAAAISEAKLEMRDWPPQVMTRRWFHLLGSTPGGSTKFLQVLLRIHQPGLTDEQIEEIDASATAEETSAIFTAAIGVADLPKGDAGGRGAGPETPPPAPPAPARRGRRGRRGRRATSGGSASTASAAG